ncbi:MAG TPA: hypothetical protein PKY72_06100 [Bacilli bacterium]|nr:hypothetical protein [Bacilli bacterium]
MKVIIKNTIEDFSELEQRIHNAMAQNIEGYKDNTKLWAEPLYSLDKSLVACAVDTEGLSGEVIRNVLLPDEEIVEIEST